MKWIVQERSHWSEKMWRTEQQIGAKANPAKEKDKLEQKEENKCKKIDSPSPACLGKVTLPFVSAKAPYKQRRKILLFLWLKTSIEIQAMLSNFWWKLSISSAYLFNCVHGFNGTGDQINIT